MPVIELEVKPEQLVKAAEQLPQEELDQLVDDLLMLRARRIAPSLSRTEAELLLKINQWFPEETWRRYRELIEKRDDFTLTEAEYAELLDLSYEVEAANVERIKGLIELATLRGVSLDEVMDQLGIKPREP